MQQPLVLSSYWVLVVRAEMTDIHLNKSAESLTGLAILRCQYFLS